MNIIRTLGFAAVAAMALGAGAAMAQQSEGYSTPEPVQTQQPAASYYRAPVTSQPQSGSADVNSMQPNRGSPAIDYGQIDSPG